MDAERRQKQAEAHQKSLQAVESSLDSLSAGKDQQIQELRRQHANAFASLSQAQQDMLAVRAELSTERVQGRRGRASMSLFSTVNLWLNKRVMRAFNTLKLHARETTLTIDLVTAHVDEKQALSKSYAVSVCVYVCVCWGEGGGGSACSKESLRACVRARERVRPRGRRLVVCWLASLCRALIGAQPPFCSQQCRQ